MTPKMPTNEIDLRVLRQAFDAVLDHLVEDLGLEKVAIKDGQDNYWDLEGQELFDSSSKPADLTVGQLTDDMGFVRLVHRGEGADASYNLAHVAPLLRYIAETVRK